MTFFKKHFKIANCILIFFLLFVVSCSNSEKNLKPYGPVFKAVVLSDEGIFRGINIGDDQDEIVAMEKGDPIENEKGYLYYEYPIDSLGIFNINYSFGETGLKEIQAEIYIDHAEDVEKIMDQFKNYFDKHYGPSESQMGFNVWSVKSDEYDELKISLSDESTDFSSEPSPGKIAVWIYPNKN